MTTNPIVLLAPAAGMEFIAMPSGTTYVSNAYGIVMVTSGSVADQQALIAAGCTALLPNAGGIASTQPGTAYTVQASDQNNAIVFTSASNAAVTLPNSLPQGFAVTLWQGAAGVVSASAAAGGSVVTPNGTSTLEQYGALYCLVISNTTGANAQWAVVAEPTNTGSGLVGASTLSSLYTQDSTAHYPQYSVAQVFSDTTTANDGTWLKTGAGNGSGNWTQVSSYTLAGLAAQIAANTSAIALLDAAVTVGQFVISAEADGLQSFRMADPLGFYVDCYLYVNGSGLLTPAGIQLANNVINAGTLQISTESDGTDALHMADPLGFYVVVQLVSAGQASDTQLYAARNESNLAAGLGPARQIAYFDTCPIAPGMSHIVMDGQSLAQAEEGWPSLSTTTIDGNKMIGNSVRSTSPTTYSPYGGSSVLQPLVSTTEQNGVILTTTQQQALTWPATPDPFGENSVIGACNMFKTLLNRRNGLNADGTRVLLASSVGVQNQCIENLMKGSVTGYWGCVTSAVSQGKTLAAAASETYFIPAVFWMQGEGNYATGNTAAGAGHPIDNSRSGYLAKLSQLRTDFLTDNVTGIAAQTDSYGNVIPPAFFTYQTARPFVSDFTGSSDALSISMAQWDFGNLNGCYCVGPDYAMTGVQNSHLDANGYRWMGMMFAKVMHRVVNLRQNWKPLAPRGLTAASNTVATTGFVLNANVLSIDFNVPEPPLAFDNIYGYSAYVTTLFSDRGFTVIDSLGGSLTQVPISGVRIVYDTIVEITMARTPVGVTYVRYGDATYHGGCGNLRDSDPTVASESYYYASGSGQQSAANISALVGNPYPLFNWCCLFNQRIQ